MRVGIHQNKRFRWLTFPPLNRFGDIEHGFSLRPFEPQKLNRSQLLEAIRLNASASGDKLALTDQVHSPQVAVAEKEGTHQAVDGLLTQQPGLILGAFAADCLLIYLYDPVRMVVGLLHAGRRGTRDQISLRAINLMVSRFQTSPADCVAVFSPGIGPCHYEMDLEEENAEQLAGRGVLRIYPRRMCTFCHSELFYSYRKGERQRRMFGWIAIRPGDAPP